MVGLWLMLAGQGGLARAGVIDRVAFVVESELVLESEIRLERELAGRDRSTVPFWEPGVRTAGERLVDAAAIRALIGDLGLYQPSRDDVRARREAIRTQFDDRGSWQAFLDDWGLDEDALEVVLRRRMVVERYFARNLLASPDDRDRWLQEAESMLEQIRPRVGIRAIEARGEASR